MDNAKELELLLEDAKAVVARIEESLYLVAPSTKDAYNKLVGTIAKSREYERLLNVDFSHINCLYGDTACYNFARILTEAPNHVRNTTLDKLSKINTPKNMNWCECIIFKYMNWTTVDITSVVEYAIDMRYLDAVTFFDRIEACAADPNKIKCRKKIYNRLVRAGLDYTGSAISII